MGPGLVRRAWRTFSTSSFSLGRVWKVAILIEVLSLSLGGGMRSKWFEVFGKRHLELLLNLHETPGTVGGLLYLILHA